MTDQIKHLTRKRPALTKAFLAIYAKDSNVKYETLQSLYTTLQTFRNILKDLKFESYNTFSALEKDINIRVDMHQAKTLVKRILTNRYSHICNDTTVNLVYELKKRHNIKYDDLKITLKTHLEYIDNSNVLNSKLNQLLHNLDGGSVLKKLLKLHSKLEQSYYIKTLLSLYLIQIMIIIHVKS